MTQEPDKALDALDVLHTYARRDHSKYPRYNAEIDDLMRGVRDEITSLRAEVGRLKARIADQADSIQTQHDFWTAKTQNIYAEVERLKQRESDLLSANNRYLERARTAETERDRLTAELEAARAPKVPMYPDDGGLKKQVRPVGAGFDVFKVVTDHFNLTRAAHTLEKKL